MMQLSQEDQAIFDSLILAGFRTIRQNQVLMTTPDNQRLFYQLVHNYSLLHERCGNPDILREIEGILEVVIFQEREGDLEVVSFMKVPLSILFRNNTKWCMHWIPWVCSTWDYGSSWADDSGDTTGRRRARTGPSK